MFGHSYYVSRHVTKYVKEYKCKYCKKELTTDSSGKLVELTPKYKEINNVLENIHNKRIMKISNKHNLLIFKH